MWQQEWTSSFQLLSLWLWRFLQLILVSTKIGIQCITSYQAACIQTAANNSSQQGGVKTREAWKMDPKKGRTSQSWWMMAVAPLGAVLNGVVASSEAGEKLHRQLNSCRCCLSASENLEPSDGTYPPQKRKSSFCFLFTANYKLWGFEKVTRITHGRVLCALTYILAGV